MGITKGTLGSVFGKPGKATFKLPKKLQRTPSGPARNVDWSFLAERFYAQHYNSESKPWGHWLTREDWQKMNPYGPRSQGVFHPSSGLTEESAGCGRQILFDLICAPQSRSAIDPKLGKILDNGTNRHTGLHTLFLGMARLKFMGVDTYRLEVEVNHERIPIHGHLDGIVTLESGHEYVLDFKTINDANFKKRFNVEKKHTAQLVTYMGIAGVKQGYVIYENKNNQDWATPMERMRVDFDARQFSKVEQFCLGMLENLAANRFPAYDERVCDASITFCKYTKVCELHRSKNASIKQLDQRPEDTKKRHLEVIQ